MAVISEPSERHLTVVEILNLMIFKLSMRRKPMRQPKP
nr:MAG TPA: hypothetical protein [Caudoviricetes sp.]